MNTRLLEMIAGLVLVLCIVEGAHKGFVMKLFSFLRLILILIITIFLVPVMQSLVAKDNVTQAGIAYVAAFLVAALVVHLVAKVLKIIDKIPVVKTVNHLGGAALGALVGIIVLWIALAVVGGFQENDWCRQISMAAKNSELLYQLQRFDPMSYLLKQMSFPTLF